MAKLISNTYAEALFELAVENKNVDEIFEQTAALQKLFSENPEFVSLLNHPKITKEEKLDTLEKTLSGKADDSIVGLLRVMVDKDRAKEIERVFENFRMKVYEYKKIGIVSVTSAVSLSDAQKKKIEAKLLTTTGYLSLETNYSVDPALIGGLVIRIGDRVVDSSVKMKLDRMTSELRKASLK